MRLASVTLSCAREPSVNITRMASAAVSIGMDVPNVDLVFFGEMVTCLYDPGNQPEYHSRSSIRLDSPILDPLRKAAENCSLYLCFGISEADGNGGIYNTQVLLDPYGEVVALHRKRNLKSSELQAGYIPGRDPVTLVNIQGAKTAILICSDAASPAAVRKLHRESPDLILLSLADDKDVNWFMARCNAALYDSWVVTANRYGIEERRYWNGHTVISNPMGGIVRRSVGKEAVLYQDLSIPTGISAVRRFFKRARIPFLVAGNPRAVLSYF